MFFFPRILLIAQLSGLTTAQYPGDGGLGGGNGCPYATFAQLSADMDRVYPILQSAFLNAGSRNLNGPARGENSDWVDIGFTLQPGSPTIQGSQTIQGSPAGDGFSFSPQPLMDTVSTLTAPQMVTWR